MAHDGVVLFRGTDGYANLDTRQRVAGDSVFPVYSLAKLFVSTLVMQLVEQGQVDLDKPASIYLHDLPARWQDITVREFLNHTSGVPEYFDGERAMSSPGSIVFPASAQAVFVSLADKPLLFPPGTDTHYADINYLVLSSLLEAHYRKPYPQIVAERIIRKLHLKHTWLGSAALPKRGVVTAYIGRDGQLEKDVEPAWPAYSFGHGELYSTLDDLARFLQAMRSGELVGKSTLQQLWQPQTLANGQRGWFATGWEYGESDGYRNVGHDGGARVRVRIVFKDVPGGDDYTFVYLASGSAKNVWSRILLDSTMAVVAPDRFPAEALSERLIGYALQSSVAGDASTEAQWIKANSVLNGEALERTIDNAGNTIRANLDVDAALRVFALDTSLFPESASAWDSLADAYAAKGDQEKAMAMHDKAHRLSAQPPGRQ